MNKRRATGLLIATIGVWAGGCGTVADDGPTTVTVTQTPAVTAPAPQVGGQPNGSTPTPGQGQAPAPSGADGSTGNDLSSGYCARNEDPGCPAGSYVGPDAIPNPNGDDSYVPCEGTICTNPDHGAGPDPEGDGPPEPGQTEMQGQ